MDVQINDEAEPFYIITKKGWELATGHSIECQGYNFFAAPYESSGKAWWRITEAESGVLLFENRNPNWIETYDEVCFFLATVIAVRVLSILNKFKQNNYEIFNEHIESFKKNNIEKWGKKPVVIVQ